MKLTFEEIKLILSWADFAVETGDGFGKEESELYDKLNKRADEMANEPADLPTSA